MVDVLGNANAKIFFDVSSADKTGETVLLRET